MINFVLCKKKLNFLWKLFCPEFESLVAKHSICQLAGDKFLTYYFSKRLTEKLEKENERVTKQKEKKKRLFDVEKQITQRACVFVCVCVAFCKCLAFCAEGLWKLIFFIFHFPKAFRSTDPSPPPSLPLFPNWTYGIVLRKINIKKELYSPYFLFTSKIFLSKSPSLGWK